MVKQTWACSDCSVSYFKEEDAIKCEEKHKEYAEEQKRIIKENSKMVFDKSVEIDKNSFDELVGRVNIKIPKDCNYIILMGNRGHGLEPYNLLLPHQVYVSDLRKTFEEEGFGVIVLIPIKYKDCMNIVYKDKFYEQKWKNK